MFLTDYDRLTLLKPAIFILQRIPNDEREEILIGLACAFEAWKRSIADDNGMIPCAAPRLGLLGGFPSSPSGMKHYSEIPIHEIGGQPPPLDNRIDLAIKLWLENFPPFTELVYRHGTDRLLTLVATSEPDQVSPSSLIRVTSILWEFLIAERGMVGQGTAGPKAAKKRGNGGKAGALARGKGKTRRAKETDRLICQIGKDLHERNLDLDGEAVADMVYAKTREWKETRHLARSTIRRKLSGIFGRPKRIRPRP